MGDSSLQLNFSGKPDMPLNEYSARVASKTRLSTLELKDKETIHFGKFRIP